MAPLVAQEQLRIGMAVPESATESLFFIQKTTLSEKMSAIIMEEQVGLADLI